MKADLKQSVQQECYLIYRVK